MTWHPTGLTRSQQQERRLHFAKHLAQGEQHYREICIYYRISKSTYYAWRKKWMAQGVEGLKARIASGRPRSITAAQEEQLKTWLQCSAMEQGFPDPTWTSKRVRDLIGLKFDVWYHPHHVSKILKRWGFSYQKPDKRAIERNKARIAEWQTTVIPDLQKQVQEGTTLVFLDETGFSLKTTSRRSWAPRGHTPLISTRMNWERLSVIGAVTSGGKFYQHTWQGNVTGTGVAQFFRHLLKQISGKMTVVLDNGGIHKTQQVKAVLEKNPRLQLQFLPPYVPELNPIELLWAHIKQHLLGNVLSRKLEDLKRRLRGVWQRVRRLDLSGYFQTGSWKPQQVSPVSTVAATPQ